MLFLAAVFISLAPCFLSYSSESIPLLESGRWCNNKKEYFSNSQEKILQLISTKNDVEMEKFYTKLQKCPREKQKEILNQLNIDILLRKNNPKSSRYKKIRKVWLGAQITKLAAVSINGIYYIKNCDLSYSPGSPAICQNVSYEVFTFLSPLLYITTIGLEAILLSNHPGLKSICIERYLHALQSKKKTYQETV